MKTTPWLVPVLAGALVAFGAAPGLAQEPAEPAPPAQPEPDQPEPEPGARPPHMITPWGVSVTAGIGVVDSPGSVMDDLADIGATFDIRANVFTRNVLGVEAAFVRTIQDIEALGLDPDAKLASNGLEASARLNLDRYVEGRVGSARFYPFATAGLGWARFYLNDDSFNTSSLRDSDNVFTIPLSVGGAGQVGRFVFDARFTWRETLDNDLAPDASQDQWTLGVHGGIEF